MRGPVKWLRSPSKKWINNYLATELQSLYGRKAVVVGWREVVKALSRARFRVVSSKLTSTWLDG